MPEEKKEKRTERTKSTNAARAKTSRAKTVATAKKKSTKKTAKASNKRKYLVVVESPAKSKTINKILGTEYKVMASMGHIIDLPAGRMGIDFENDFKPEYTVMKGRKKYLTSLAKEARSSDAVYLAADPDREGEAICWHLKNEFVAKDKDLQIYRVSFDEITAKAVKAAFEHPGIIDMDKVNAQQARRILDRIVGYSLSPLLWGKVTRGLSAGRVQSIAVRVITEREEAIRNFESEEYWSIEAVLRKKDTSDLGKGVPASFIAKLIKHKGEKIVMSDKGHVDNILAELEKEKYVVSEITRRNKKSHPRAPYTTSVLQQEAFNKLNYSASKTMRVAQKLYEGVEIGSEGSVGLITYMRTDSVRISKDAEAEAKQYIKDIYGEKYYPDIPKVYKSKKRAQEAHEAIRPTLPLRSPKAVASFLSDDEYKLYNLIWKRFISSQMESALFSVLTVHIDAGEYRFRSGGAQLIFDGFLRPYKEDGMLEEEQEKGQEKIPPLETGEETDPEKIIPDQHFTKPPPRYTDASLVKDLEEKGIGRPSTYAPIIKTVINRHYIKRMGKSLQPTDLGELVNSLLVDNFPEIVNVKFTARMENELDEIEDGKVGMPHVVNSFYSEFAKQLEEAKERMKSVKRQEVPTDGVCEECGRPMVIKWGRRGRFLSCSGFPACKFAKPITTGVKCPDEGCEGELVERKSRRGAFYGCTKYPKCTYTSRKLPDTGDGGNKEEEVEG